MPRLTAHKHAIPMPNPTVHKRHPPPVTLTPTTTIKNPKTSLVISVYEQIWTIADGDEWYCIKLWEWYEGG